MTGPSHSPRSMEGWTPVRLFHDGGRPTAEWCQLGNRRLAEPFFNETVRAARADGGAVCRTPADVLADLGNLPPDAPVAGLVFHLSRCGSTLVSRMLGALPEHIVVSEPETLETVLEPGAWPPDITGETRLGWLRGLVHAYGRRRFPEERRLFIKLDPWHLLDLARLRTVFPGVPWVFLYRDPVEILVSQSDNFANAMLPDPLHAARLGLTLFEALSMSNEEYCARALGRIAQAAADAAGADPAGRLVAYPELPAAVETVVAPWFGWTPGDEARARMRAVARFHSKAAGQRVFEADAARKQREADGELRALAQDWVGAAYARLEAARAAR